MKKIKILTGFLSIAIVVVLFQNCSGGGVSKKSTSSKETANSSTYAQSPKIRCTLTTTNNGQTEVIHQISSSSSSNSTTQNVFQNQPINVDCNQSFDDRTAKQDLILEYKTDTTSWVRATGNAFQIAFASAPSGQLEIRLTDLDGNITENRSIINVQCPPSSNTNPITINPALVRVNSTTNIGFFDFMADGAVSGGVGLNGAAPVYQYYWDFDGDGNIDKYYDYQRETWEVGNTQSTTRDVFHIFNDTNRKITLRVKDSCNFQAQVTVDRVISLPVNPANTALAALRTDSHYIQGTVSPAANNPAQRTEMTDVQVFSSYRSSTPQSESDQKRLQCNYNRTNGIGTLSIEGWNFYGSPEDSFKKQGLTLDIRNIADNVALGSSAVVPGTINRLVYHVAGTYDTLNPEQTSESFTANSGCTLEMSIQRDPVSNIPCGSSSTGFAAGESLLFRGKYNCPNLVSNRTNRNVQVNEGYFYCEIQRSDACVGGGGTSGGTRPRID